ncbi:hypothetical protein THF1C08_1160001 [Vibrio jasicida]|uniref:Uncharacterized protein n=1 Tax=Vibrio jasicida TaxID=766224 RepID=A0AAU9QG12_9VIBR|nr:hypothetical protein THF1C08_1160001 [Vibrio jasicida]CAH1572348.1 hypothetical protein THF1A12_1180001 [Vibrio jasicida]
METLAELLKSGDYWIFALIGAGLVSFRIPALIETLQNIRSKRLIHALEASQNQLVPEQLRVHFKEEVEAEYRRFSR